MQVNSYSGQSVNLPKIERSFQEISSNFQIVADTQNMVQKKSNSGPIRCRYLRDCYLAEELKCFGYKSDCPLYQESNDESYNEDRFDEAMDRLIDKTRRKHLKAARLLK